MMEKRKELWVYLETRHNGIIENVGLELLSEGRILADRLGCSLVGVVIGDKTERAVDQARLYGADSAIVVDAPEYMDYSTEAYVHALFELVSKYTPDVILIGATTDGRDMAPRLAARLRTGLTADCTGLDVDKETGKILWTRPAFSGNLMATIICRDHMPQMGTVRPGVFRKEQVGAREGFNVRHEIISFPAECARTQLLKVIRDFAEDTADLENAEIIVSGGRGVKGKEGFKLISELAEAIGGEVGASRAAVEEGWISRSHQVGQTGSTVAPKVYIACGISGAIQHQAGMSRADKIIAINIDPEAPIFKIADYGIVGDLFAVIPALIAEIKKYRTHET